MSAHPTPPFSVWYNPAYEAWVVEPHIYPNGKPVSPFPIVFRIQAWAEATCALLNRLVGETTCRWCGHEIAAGHYHSRMVSSDPAVATGCVDLPVLEMP